MIVEQVNKAFATIGCEGFFVGQILAAYGRLWGRTNPAEMSKSSGSVKPALNRSQAIAPMTALSVQSANGAICSSVPVASASASNRSRRRPLAATPPPTQRRLRCCFFNARNVFVTRQSTTASWKLAATSATSSPRDDPGTTAAFQRPCRECSGCGDRSPQQGSAVSRGDLPISVGSPLLRERASLACASRE